METAAFIIIVLSAACVPVWLFLRIRQEAKSRKELEEQREAEEDRKKAFKEQKADLEFELSILSLTNKEREDIVEVVEESDKDSRISALEAQLVLLTKAIMGAPDPAEAGPKTPAADTPQVYTRDLLLSMDINDLRPLAVSYETSGAGTRESLADRILEQIAKGVKPK